MNTPVSFLLAKLLKEKGFEQELYPCYGSDGEIHTAAYFLVKETESYFAPNIANVVMWLYEKHGIWMFTDRTNNWFWTIQKSTGENIHQEDLPITEKFICHGFNSPTEAYEAAIKHTLDNLI